MPLSIAQYTGDGSNRNFSIPFPYIDRTHIQVRVSGSVVPFTFLSNSVVQTATAPAPGAAVDVRRVTPSSTSLVDFVDASTLLESDLDLSALQTLYVSQETKDAVDNTIGLTVNGTFDAQGRRVINVGAPTDPNDAARKADVDGVVAASGAAAAASAAAALASENAAAASATAANNVVTSGTVGAVRHDVVQSLTGGQQTQARANIGAAALAGASAQTFSVAPASANEHAVSRVFGDARYDRIMTSPTALTNGATIPSTENGRFYSMALPAVQTCSLPASAGLPDGFSVIVRATGMPSGFQTAYVGGNSKNIQYRGQGYAFFVLVGLTETFRFTWTSGLDVWQAECLQQPLIIEMSRGYNATAWNIGSTSFVGLYYNTVGGTSSIFNVSNSIITLVPAAGVYTYNHRVHMSASAGGGTAGVGYMVGVNKVSGVPDSSQGYIFTGMDTTGLSDNYMNLWNTQPLQQGQIVGAAYAMSVSTLWVFPGNNAQTITLVSR